MRLYQAPPTTSLPKKIGEVQSPFLQKETSAAPVKRNFVIKKKAASSSSNGDAVDGSSSSSNGSSSSNV